MGEILLLFSVAKCYSMKYTYNIEKKFPLRGVNKQERGSYEQYIRIDIGRKKDIWQDFVAHFKSETTAASYQTDIAEVMNYFQKDFLQIGKTDAAQYFLYLRERADLGKIQYGTVAKKLRELHSFSAYICENREKGMVLMQRFKIGFRNI